MKMVFHFARVPDVDIITEGETQGQCLDKAVAEREKQCKTNNVKGEVVPDGTLVSPEAKGKLNV